MSQYWIITNFKFIMETKKPALKLKGGGGDWAMFTSLGKKVSNELG